VLPEMGLGKLLAKESEGKSSSGTLEKLLKNIRNTIL